METLIIISTSMTCGIFLGVILAYSYFSNDLEDYEKRNAEIESALFKLYNRYKNLKNAKKTNKNTTKKET